VSLALLYARMLRHRVALMIWMFMLLAVAFHGGLAGPSWNLLFATVLLASSYVAATTVNDLADLPIDRVNHPGDRGRPLVTGEALPAQMVGVNAIGAAGALAAAAALGPVALAIAAVALLVGYTYSVGPVRFSYRTYAAPAVLSVAYVLVPYTVGVVVARAHLTPRDALFAGSLFLLFVARITLKDFRDRAGDARYGKPTLLLRFGKDVTCLVSATALISGDALLLAALRPPAPLGALLELYVVAIGWMLFRLWRSAEGRDEQVAIGIGARVGNGLLVTVLAWLALSGEAAPATVLLLLVVSIFAIYAGSFVALVSHPEQALIGYKG
jgi:geranylgeranylglycerol-phosphate geranylgeranyltransferase